MHHGRVEGRGSEPMTCGLLVPTGPISKAEPLGQLGCL